jgi:hypothetical protein
MGRPLWRGYGSVVYDCYWPSPAQSFTLPGPAGLMPIFYCLRFQTSPTWRVRPLPVLYSRQVKVKVKVIYVRQSVEQSILVSGTHLGPWTNFSFSLNFSLASWECYFVAPSLTTGRVCNLLLLLVLASAVPRDSRLFFIVPILETPPTWKARSPYLYPPGTGWPSYTPGHWVPFPSSLTTRRDYGGGTDHGSLTLPGIQFNSRCFLLLAKLRWRYANPPPRGHRSGVNIPALHLPCHRI